MHKGKGNGQTSSYVVNSQPVLYIIALLVPPVYTFFTLNSILAYNQQET